MTQPLRYQDYAVGGLTLKPLTPDNKTQMMDIQQAMLLALPNPAWYYPSEEWEFDEWLTQREAFGYFDGERLAAFAVLTPAALRHERSYALKLGEPSENTFDFHDVMVLPAYRGRGIHTHFLRLFADLAKAANATAIYATVDPENGASYRNFERAGYVCVATQPAYDGRMRKYYRFKGFTLGT